MVRDADLLAELGERAGCTVCISVPTVDEGAWAALEPGTAHPLQRLRAVRELRKAGVRAGVLMAPIVPGFTTQPARLEATIRAIAEHDAAFVGSNVLHLKGGTKDHFLGFLATEFPQMLDGYQRMYPGAYAPPAYVATVRSLLKDLRSKYRVGENRYGDETDRDDAETNVVTDHSEAVQSESEDESCAASAGEQRSFEWAVRPSPRAR